MSHYIIQDGSSQLKLFKFQCMLYTGVVKTVYEDELLRFAEDHNVSPRKLADWRSEGLLPKPISSKGLGKGKGRT